MKDKGGKVYQQFKADLKDSNKETLLNHAFRWYQESHILVAALKDLQERYINVESENRLLHEIVEQINGQHLLTPERLEELKQNRLNEINTSKTMVPELLQHGSELMYSAAQQKRSQMQREKGFVKATTIKKMQLFRREGKKLNDFLDAAANKGVDDLFISETGEGNGKSKEYKVTVDAPPSDDNKSKRGRLDETVIKYSTLESYWTAAGNFTPD